MWEGNRLEDMSREELIEAMRVLGAMYADVLNAQQRRIDEWRRITSHSVALQETIALHIAPDLAKTPGQ